MATTPLMNLDLPVVTTTLGPEWATLLNAALELIDAHDHTSGSGPNIPAAALNINEALQLNSNNVNAANSYRMDSLSAALTGPNDIRAIYSVNGDLYYNNTGGTAIQITSGAALNAASIGAIGGDYSTSSASLFYTSASALFTFDQSSGRRANIDVGDVVIRDTAAAGLNGITLQSPSALGASYTLTLPTGLPANTLPVIADVSGNLSYAQIATSQIADLAVTNNKIANSTIAKGKLAFPIKQTTQTFTSSGTFNVPSDVYAVIVEGCGGGSGGSSAIRGGGGSGAFLGTFVVPVTPSGSVSVTIGAGGAAGAAGSDSSFGSTVFKGAYLPGMEPSTLSSSGTSYGAIPLVIDNSGGGATYAAGGQGGYSGGACVFAGGAISSNGSNSPFYSGGAGNSSGGGGGAGPFGVGAAGGASAAANTGAGGGANGGSGGSGQIRVTYLSFS